MNQANNHILSEGEAFLKMAANINQK